MSGEITIDFARGERIGLDEAIFCAGKSVAQIETILDLVAGRGVGVLMTRLDAEKLEALHGTHLAHIDYSPVSRTAFYGPIRAIEQSGVVAIVSAGTSDIPVALEAERVLRYGGQQATIITDVGVAGLWRLSDRLKEIREHSIIIVVAGMDAALASVLGGLVAGPVIGVPTSVGYGVAEGGRTALHAMLVSCAPGVMVCNIDNGYGAACAALRILNDPKRLRKND
jgi:NCAIR mutase (PurE)-related protein